MQMLDRSAIIYNILDSLMLHNERFSPIPLPLNLLFQTQQNL